MLNSDAGIASRVVKIGGLLFISTDEIEDRNVKVGKGTRGWRGRVKHIGEGRVVGYLRHVQQLGYAVFRVGALPYT